MLLKENPLNIDALIVDRIRDKALEIAEKFDKALILNQLLIRLKILELKILQRHASTLVYHEPESLLVAITNRCNLRCAWCDRNNPDFEQRYRMEDMTVEEFKALFQGRKRKLRKIDLHGIGEPLLHPDLIELINIASQYAEMVQIVTNGACLTRSTAEKLARSKLSKLIVSIDSTDPETFQKIRQGGNLERLKENIQYFPQISSIPIEVWTTLSGINIEELYEITEFLIAIGAKSIQFQIVYESIIGNEKWKLNYEQLQEFKRKIKPRLQDAEISHNLDDLSLENPTEKQGVACYEPFFSDVSVSTDGNVTPCCVWTFNNLENIAELGINRAYNAKGIREIRRSLITRHYDDYCKKTCTVRIQSNI